MIKSHDLLTSESLDGPTAITRIISPQPVARLVRAADWDDAVAAIEYTCSDWGGACNPVLPATQGSESLASPWIDLLADSNIAETYTRGILPVPEDFGAEHGGMWRDDHGPMDLLGVLARLPKQRVPTSNILSAHTLTPENPWYLAYLGVWGALRQEVDAQTLQYLELREGLTFGDVVNLAPPIDRELGPEHLLESLRGREITASQLSCVGLAVTSAPVNQSLTGNRMLPYGREQALNVGPNVVVVYEPGSVEDLCLLWQLRAAHGLRPGFPLAVPVTADVTHALKHWRSEFAMKAWQLHGGSSCLLVSASVSTARMRSIAESVGGGLYQAGNYRDVLQPSWGCGYWTEDAINFTAGRARVPSFSPAEVQWFGNLLSSRLGPRFELTVVPEQWDLPPIRTMRQQRFNEARYHRGAVGPISGRRQFIEVSYVTGLDVMYAAARDRNADCAPSESGVIAETFIRNVGFSDLYPLLSPGVHELLLALCERRSANYYKEKLRRLLKEDVEEAPNGRDRLTRIEEMLRHDAGLPDEFDQAELTFGKFKKYLGGEGATKAWIDWAERRSLILRGAVVECPRCVRKAWHPAAELAPPIICRGCASPIARPFKPDNLPYSYRASEQLLRLMSKDALVHVLSQRFFIELFRENFGGIGAIFGGYPGVNFMERGSATVFGEADVLLLLSDGGIGVGECKTRAAGLVDEELEKLAALAKRLNASFTFVATLDSSTLCGDTWKRNPNEDQRPHFALTAEHLYDPHPTAPLNSDPFAWRENFTKFSSETLSPEEHKKEFAKRLVALRDWNDTSNLPWWRRHEDG